VATLGIWLGTSRFHRTVYKVWAAVYTSFIYMHDLIGLKLRRSLTHRTLVARARIRSHVPQLRSLDCDVRNVRWVRGLPHA
jgi:hypothetical protein